MTETVWPTELQLFIIWPFTENSFTTLVLDTENKIVQAGDIPAPIKVSMRQTITI